LTDDIDIQILAELAEIFTGKTGKQIVYSIAEKKLVGDDKLSSILGMNENEVRRILWKLSDHTIVTTRKEVDSESGWISYYWYLPTSQAKGLLYNIINDLTQKLEKRLEYERNNVFYWCGGKNCPRYTFDESTEFLFKCPICGKPLKPFDNSELIAALTWITGKLKKASSLLLEGKS